jgi:hypothetical protein
MTESKADFRRKLANIHNDAYDQSLDAALDRIEKVDSPNGPMIPVEDHMVAMYEALDDAAEAVAAQVLRDVIALSFMTYIPGTDDLAPIVAVSQIKRFAAERGIDLEDTP